MSIWAGSSASSAKIKQRLDAFENLGARYDSAVSLVGGSGTSDYAYWVSFYSGSNKGKLFFEKTATGKTPTGAVPSSPTDAEIRAALQNKKIVNGV